MFRQIAVVKMNDKYDVHYPNHQIQCSQIQNACHILKETQQKTYQDNLLEVNFHTIF